MGFLGIAYEIVDTTDVILKERQRLKDLLRDALVDTEILRYAQDDVIFFTTVGKASKYEKILDPSD